MTLKLKHAAAAICLATATALIAGCSGSGSSAGTPVPNPLCDATIVTDNPTTTLPWSQIVGKTNVKAFIRESESGYQVYQRPITIVSAYVVAGEDIMACTCPPQDAYGPGDSGSAVLVGGKIVGALFAGDDPQHFYVVSITQEEGTGTTTKARPTTPKSGAPAPYPNSWNFAGPASMMPLVTKNKNFAQTQHVQPVLRPQQATTPNKPIPGSRFAAVILNGPQAQIYDQATYTYQLPSGQWVGTGHMLGQGGPAQFPVFPAYTDFIENDGSVETHLSVGANGTLTFDGQFGSLIDLTKTPTLLPIIVSSTLNGATEPTITHFGVLDRGSINEEEGVDIGGSTPIDTLIYALPDLISGTGTVTTYQGGVATTTDITFSAPSESPTAFVQDVELNADEDWFAAYANTPNEQVTKVVVSVQMITAPITG